MSVRRWRVAAAAAVAAAVLLTVPALAHHSSAPFYDSTNRVELQGLIHRVCGAIGFLKFPAASFPPGLVRGWLPT